VRSGEDPSDGPMWHERAPWDERRRAASTASPGGVTPRADIAALIDRAARIGIPAWRVRTALGLPPEGAEGR